MKKKLLALAAAGLMLVSAPAPARAEAPRPFLTETVQLDNSATYTPYRVSESMAKSINEKAKEKGKDYSVTPGEPLQAGSLLVKSGDIASAATVVNFIVPEENAKNVKLLFEKNKKGEAAFQAQMTAATVNLFLHQAENLINSGAKQGVTSYNEKNKTRVPAKIFQVSIPDIEDMALSGNRWTCGMRCIAEADGFVIPLYLKAAVIQHGSEYRAMMLISSDAEKDVQRGAFEKLLNKV